MVKVKQSDIPLGEKVKQQIYENLNNFLDKVYKISQLKKGDIVFHSEPQPMDMDFFAHVVLDTNAYEGYVTALDTSNNNELTYLYTFDDFYDFYLYHNPNKIPTDDEIIKLKNKIYEKEKQTVDQVLAGKFDHLLDDY